MTDSHTDYESRWAIDPDAAALMGTDELRQNFLIEELFTPGRIKLTYYVPDLDQRPVVTIPFQLRR